MERFGDVQEEECKTFVVDFCADAQKTLANKPSKAQGNMKSFDKVVNFATTYLPIFIVVMLLCVVLLVPLRWGIQNSDKSLENAAISGSSAKCTIRLVESMPEGMNYSSDAVKFMSTFDAWNMLMDRTNETLDIASLYWTLRGDDVFNHTSAAEGEAIFNRLMSLGTVGLKKLRIAQSEPTAAEPNIDTKLLSDAHAAVVRSVNFPRLIGAGVLHTKLWIADGQHFYLGSANMDWRSLTQVKELGILAENCATLAADVAKIFNAYWYLGKNKSTIPSHWPREYRTQINEQIPLTVDFNDRYTMQAYFTSSPPPLTADGRTNDIDGLLRTIASATSFIDIAVMDYFPLMIYLPHLKYWPLIDDALRVAAIERKVKVRMLISWWKHSKPSEDFFLKSLSSLSDSYAGVSIEIKRFVVPANDDQARIPFARVNHNKYMVTDNTAYISTSNWSGDYFTNTAGIALVLRSNNNNINNSNSTNSSDEDLRTDLVAVFERDWQSPYALPLRMN